MKRDARIAGLWYLLLVLVAPVGIYLPGAFVVNEDPIATASRIAASESLFRLGIVGELVAAVVSIFLVLALYRLLRGVSATQAVLMVVLSLAQVPIAFANATHRVAALMLVRGQGFLSALDAGQRDVLALFFMHLHGQGTVASEMFWGLWLFPLGWLVLRSGFLPRWLGGWVILNGVAYVAMSVLGLLRPAASDLLSRLLLPLLLGEMVLMLWLVVVGARPKPAA